MGQIDAKLFTANKSKTAVEYTIDSIKSLLISKQLLPGDKLPTEMELAENLQISRGSVREAMKILASYGIISIKRGDGTYISEEMTRGLFDHLLFQMILTDFDKKKLLELRELIEVGMLQLVIKNATDQSIQQIKEAHNKMEREVQRGKASSRELAQLDSNFHVAIAEATENPLIQKIYGFVLELFLPSLETSVSKGEKGKFSVELHSNIMKGIENRDLKQTKEAVKLSIEQWFNLI